MKKYIFTLLTFSAFISINSQDFVGKDAHLYLNATVKPIEKSQTLQKYAYKNFYLQFDTVSKILTKESIGKNKQEFKPFQAGEPYSPVSDYSKLVGMEFKVVGVYEETAKYDFEKGQYFVLVLKNDALGTIFYEYDSKFEHNLELTTVGGIKFPEGYWCSKLTIINDKFEDKTSYYSPQESGFIVIKVISNGVPKYYLDVEEGGSTVNVNGKGLYLLFDDGSKINKENAEINVKVGNKYTPYIYSAFIELTNEDLNILKTKKITDNRLYIYDGTVDSESAILIQEFVKCITVTE
jgi:hypothetical protein